MLGRVLWTETLKIKRTLARWMVLVAPLTVVALQFLALWRRPAMLARSCEPWLGLTRGVLGLWAVLMPPLFLTLEGALLAGLEHAENNWKSLFTLLSFCATAFQRWISLRWHSFTVAVSSGMEAVVAGFILINSEKWGRYWPWALPIHAVGSKPLGPELVLGAVAAGLAVAVLGGADFRRREVR